MASYSTNAPHFGRWSNYRDKEKAQRYWAKKRADPNYKGGDQAAVNKLMHGGNAKKDKDVKEDKVDEQIGASHHHLSDSEKQHKEFIKGMAKWWRQGYKSYHNAAKKKPLPEPKEKKDMKEEANTQISPGIEEIEHPKISLPTEYGGEHSVRKLYMERSLGGSAHDTSYGRGLYGSVADSPSRARPVSRPVSRPTHVAQKPVQRPVTRPTNVPRPVQKPAATVEKPAAPVAAPPLPSKKPVSPAPSKPTEIVAKPGPNNTTPGSGPDKPPVKTQIGPNNTSPGSGQPIPAGAPRAKGAYGGGNLGKVSRPAAPVQSSGVKVQQGPTNTTPGGASVPPNLRGTRAGAMFASQHGPNRPAPSAPKTPESKAQQPYVPSVANIPNKQPTGVQVQSGPTNTTPGSGKFGPGFHGFGNLGKVSRPAPAAPSSSVPVQQGPTNKTPGSGTYVPSNVSTPPTASVAPGATAPTTSMQKVQAAVGGAAPPSTGSATSSPVPSSFWAKKKLPEGYGDEYSVRKIYDEEKGPPMASSDARYNPQAERNSRINAQYRQEKKAKSVENRKKKAAERRKEPYLPFGKNQLPHKKNKD